jgi:hypothetical protein
VDMQKTDRWRGEVTQWSHRVTVVFGALGGLTSACPSAAIPPHARPYESLWTSFAVALVPGCYSYGRTGTLGAVGDLERTVEVSRQKCSSRWRPWCREFVVSPAVGEVVDPRSVRSSLSPSWDASNASYDGGAVTDLTRERASATLSCPEMCLIYAV